MLYVIHGHVLRLTKLFHSLLKYLLPDSDSLRFFSICADTLLAALSKSTVSNLKLMC